MADEAPSTEASSEPILQVEEIPSGDGSSDVTQIKDIKEDIGFVPLQGFLGIENPDSGQKEKLDFIWGFFSKGRDRADTLNAIKDTQHSLSQPEVGENYLHKLYSYTKLLADARSIEREKKAYTNDNANNNSVDRTQQKI